MSTLLWSESFDFCTAAQLLDEWNYSGTAGPGSIVAGRTGNGWTAPAGGSIFKTFTQGLQSIVTWGHANKAGGSDKDLPMQLWATVSNGVSFSFPNTSDGRVFARLSTGGVAADGPPSAWVMSAGIWYYLECQAAITAGVDGGGTHSTFSVAYTFKVNGTVVLSGTVVRALNGVYDASLIKWSHIKPIDGSTIDDLYVTDDEFLGDVGITCIYANGDGASSQWSTLSGPDHFAMVSEHPPDDDTSYNSDDGTSLGHIDLYNLTDLVGSPGIKGIRVLSRVKNDIPGSSTLQGVYRSGATQLLATDSVSLTNSSYSYMVDTLRKSPFTTLDWTAAEINGLQVGLKRVA